MARRKRTKCEKWVMLGTEEDRTRANGRRNEGPARQRGRGRAGEKGGEKSKNSHAARSMRARQSAVTRVVEHEKGRICLFLSALGAWRSVLTYTVPGCDHVFRATACRSQTMMGSL